MNKRVQSENLIFITVDALRWDCLGANNKKLREEKLTPNIDGLADQSFNFQNVFTQGVYTKAAFPPIFYSQFFSKMTKKDRVDLDWGKIIKDEVSWPEVFRENGYLTAGFTTNPFTGRMLGYDKCFNYFNDDDRPTSISLYNLSPKLDKKIKKILPNKLKSSFSPKIYLDSDFINFQAKKWIKKSKPRPFCLWLHYMDVHEPYYGGVVPPSEEDDFEKVDKGKIKRAYQKSVAYFDNSFGQLLSFLEKEGLKNNTTIVLTSDHGEFLGEHGNYSHPAEFYDPLIRVPLIVHCPDTKPKKINNLTGLIDIGPSLANLFGLRGPKKSGKKIDFSDFSKHRNVVITEALTPFPDGKPEDSYPPTYSVRSNRYKFIHYPTKNREELYDLREDPQEKHNVIEQNEKIKNDLIDKFRSEYYGSEEK